jgi:site-specific recombinase XerD
MTFADSIVLAGIPNSGTREAYRFALSRFFSWYRAYSAREGAKFDRTAIMAHLALPEVQSLASSTRNCALAALKRLSRELHYRQLITFETWQGIVDIRSEKQRSNKAPNWLTVRQLNELMTLPPNDLHGLRDRAILAIVTGCGLRRTELCDLKVSNIEQRSGRWVFVVKGKGGKTRFAPIPSGVKVAIDVWLKQRAPHYETGNVPATAYLICPVLQGGAMKDRRLSDDAVYKVIQEYGVKLGVPKLAPHDLRRTFARLTDDAGGNLRALSKFLGHESLTTTERYIGDNISLTKTPGDLLDTDWMGGMKES